MIREEWNFFLLLCLFIPSFFLDEMTQNGANKLSKPLECAHIRATPLSFHESTENEIERIEQWTNDLLMLEMEKWIAFDRVYSQISQCIESNAFYPYIYPWRWRNANAHIDSEPAWQDLPLARCHHLSLGTCVFYAYFRSFLLGMNTWAQHNACVWHVISCQVVDTVFRCAFTRLWKENIIYLCLWEKETEK